MKSYHSPPIVIGPDRKIQSLKRLSKVHTVFDENYLQELLADHPKLLPVQEIRSDVVAKLMLVIVYYYILIKEVSFR
jgi:hypothetical protein